MDCGTYRSVQPPAGSRDTSHLILYDINLSLTWPAGIKFRMRNLGILKEAFCALLYIHIDI